MQKITAQIHLGHIQSNAKLFSSLTKNRLCAVVKANAYGHGAEEVVNALEGIADCFAVALIEEGLEIRTAACGKDILIFTPPLTKEEGLAIAENGFIASVPDLYTAKLLSQICGEKKLPLQVHLKVNTGMNRYGMNGSMLGKVCAFLQNDPFVRVSGIYSHLYTTNEETSEEQRILFCRMLEICKRYYPHVIAHLGGTYAALLGEKFAFDMTRIGIGLYGYFPDMESKKSAKFLLQKGMTVSSSTVINRQLSFGGVGYGNKRTKEELREIQNVSICRFGYADGFLRTANNGIFHEDEILNNLCMDVCMRKSTARRGEKVLILTDADKIAKATGTISYEVLCAATRRAEFIYDDDETAFCGSNEQRTDSNTKGALARIHEKPSRRK
ncbi:MAG: alanine racemase [Clostridiales bacterium]|nr:alanine racemase [Clostridiales bacterium]